MKLILRSRTPFVASLLVTALAALVFLSTTSLHSQTFQHPGALSTQTDLDRMAAKVAAGEQPWKGSWDTLVGNTDNWVNHTPEAVATVCAGSGCTNNFMNLARDAARAYQLALRYHGDGSTWAADKAVEIFNAWASTHTGFSGDSNAQLRAGLYGYQFACAGELMRNYSGWNSSDFTAFQNYMLNEFYPINSDFLIRHNNTCNTHYWANWEHANMASMLAIGVLCDDQAVFDEALAYFYNGIGNGSIYKAVWYIHPNGLAQWQESGRDQGHSLMGPQLLGTICEIAWNQGIDLYGYDKNRFLASVEYISKYNTWNDVPYRWYTSCDTWFSTGISDYSRGLTRPGWDLVYNHYVNRMGLAAPYTGDYAENTRPDGGGFNYGGNSGGYDGLGFTTLTHSRDPIASGAAPSALRPTQQNWQVTLSWAGSAYAQSYNVKRSTTSGGPYATIATVGVKNLFYVDSGLTADTTYYYVVSANTSGGETANSAEASVIAVATGGTTTQAENATFGGGAGAGSGNAGYNGSGYADFPSSGGYLELTGIDGGDGGPTTLAFRYAMGDTARKGLLIVNGASQDIILPSTGDWGAWNTHLETVTLNSGTNNTIRIESSGEDFGNLDELTVKDSTASSPATVPSAPGGLGATLNGSQMDVSWNSVANAASYNIKRATSSGGPYVILDNLTGTSFSDDIELSGGTTYYYVVTALNSAGESADSIEDSVFLPPMNLTAAGSDSTVALDWNDAASGSDLDSFNVYRSTTSGSGYSQIATGVASSAYIDSTVANSTPYYYVVTAVNTNAVESAYSNEASAIPAPAYQESNGVLSMEAENGVIGSRWITGSDTGASNDAYIEVDPIYDWTGGSPECTSPNCLAVYNFNISTSDNYTFWFRMNSGNAADDSFFWRIDGGNWNLENDRYGIGSWFSTAIGNLNVGDYTLEIAYRENGARLDKFVVQLDSLTAPSGDGPAESSQSSGGGGTPPDAPSGLGATAVSSSQIDLSWTASSGADSYNIKRATTSGGSYTTIATGETTTSYSDTGLSASTTYYYVVSAVNADGESANSAEAGATTEAAPTEPSVITDGTYTIVARHSGKVLEVANSSTADGATVQQWAANGGANQEWTVTHLGNSEHQILGVQSGKSLDIDGGSTADGANVQIWTWVDASNQRFLFTATDSGYYRVTPVHSGKSVDVEGTSIADGANVHQWAYLGGQNQQWKLEPVASTPPPSSTIHVADIQANRVNQGKGQSKAEAIVTILDGGGSPVSGALVTVAFTGAIAETKSGTTNGNGVVTILTDSSAGNPANTTACVNNVTHSSLTYDSAANVVTCDNTF